MSRFLWLMVGIVGCDGNSSKDSGSNAGLDSDGDGYIAIEAGGDDCNDNSPSVFPGAPEVWYDGTDQNCDGASDYDRDGDGEESIDFGGTDCNDGDPSINTGSTEVPGDGIDNNCDGKQGVTGGLALTEVMTDPEQVEDSLGQWFEVVNTDVTDLDVAGWEFSNAAGQSFTVDAGTVVPVGARLVFGASIDLAVNGGAPVSELWGSNFRLEKRDKLVLKVGGEERWTVDWSGEDYPHPTGASMTLDGSFPFDRPSTGADWCVGTSVYGDGDLGTPGVLNDSCGFSDLDGDGYTVAQGDCDDQRNDAYPGAVEFRNGSDDDCDGEIDNLTMDAGATSPLDGNAGDFLGSSGVGMGALREEGKVDLIVGSAHDATAAGAIRGLIYPNTGVWSSYAFVSVLGKSAGSQVSVTPARAGDQDGDGMDDLLAVGVDSSGAGTKIVLTMIPGGQFLAGEKYLGDGVINLAGTTGTSSPHVLGDLDLNGDGFDEIVLGDPLSSSVTYRSGRVNIIDSSQASGAYTFKDSSFTAEVDGSYGADLVGMGLGGEDLDGDGYGELLVGAPGSEEDIADVDAGTWTVLRGGLTLPSDGRLLDRGDTTFYSAVANTGLGFGAPAFGDFDGDGALDLALGSFSGNKVWVFLDVASKLGAAVDVDAEANVVLSGDDHFGFALAAGDFEKNGMDDLMVGAPAVASETLSLDWETQPGTGPGTVYLFADVLGGATVLSLHTGTDDLLGSVFGVSTDVNGDSREDLPIAAPRFGSGNEGRIWLYQGRDQ